MAVKSFKPYSAGRRFMTVASFDEITASKPEKSLTERLKKNGGRNQQGRLTVRHQGGGHKRLYRVIDFKRTKDGIPARVATIEYDPNRSARIALLNYVDGEKRYILAPNGLKVGDQVVSGPDADIKVGNALPLKNIPVGTTVHNVELKIGKGAQLVRSAGTSAQLMAKAIMHSSACRLVSSARCTSIAALRSVKSATSSTRTSRSVRLAATVGSAFARRTAASR